MKCVDVKHKEFLFTDSMHMGWCCLGFVYFVVYRLYSMVLYSSVVNLNQNYKKNNKKNYEYISLMHCEKWLANKLSEINNKTEITKYTYYIKTEMLP